MNKKIISDPQYIRHLWEVDTGTSKIRIPLTDDEELAYMLGGYQ